MDFINWYKNRGFKFITQRGKSLLKRYSGSPDKAIQRNEACIGILSQLGCYPTFAVPGLVIKHHPREIRRLQDCGAEIAVHGYNHVDMRTFSPQEAIHQLLKAVDQFSAHGLSGYGFRCPYLSASDQMLAEIPKGVFLYSSNKAILWDIPGYGCMEENSVLYDTICSFYRPARKAEVPSVPYAQPNLIEIPTSVPDDLQLFDGLSLSLEEVAKAWTWVLNQTHQQGELFNLMFHPELASDCSAPFVTVLSEARELQPKVWIARLSEIAQWWQEKASFTTATEPVSNGLVVRFSCSDRATILARGLPGDIPAGPWDGKYQRLQSRVLALSDGLRPWIGVSDDVPQAEIFFLEEQGYILDRSPLASQCTLFLDRARINANPGRVSLLGMIETSGTPLIRYGRWPDGCKSALSFTGDLDALSLVDYAMRLF